MLSQQSAVVVHRSSTLLHPEGAPQAPETHAPAQQSVPAQQAWPFAVHGASAANARMLRSQLPAPAGRTPGGSVSPVPVDGDRRRPDLLRLRVEHRVGHGVVVARVHHHVAVLAAAREEHPEVAARRHGAPRRVEVQVLVAGAERQVRGCRSLTPLARFSACAVPGDASTHVM